MKKMEWDKLLSTKRFKVESNEVVESTDNSSKEGAFALRSDFLVDYDRVVFSSSFRRLGRKTQVHPFAENDHTHNRLTHSIEVASVGRSLGNALGVMIKDELPKNIKPTDIGSIVQVACLAHDIGNPPFGHAGEEALRAWFRSSENSRYLSEMSDEEVNDLKNYEGNAHTIRIVTNLETYKNSGGMRLTSASIGSLIKYPWTSSYSPKYLPKDCSKFNFYQTELELIRSVFKELGIIEESPNVWSRHPLSYLMEAADDICYALLDVEDAFEMGVLSENDVKGVLKPIIGKEQFKNRADLTFKQRLRLLRGKAIGEAIEEVVNTFYQYRKEILRGELKSKDLLSRCSSSEVSEWIKEAKELAREKVFMHPKKIMTEIAVFPCLGSILSVLIPAVFEYVKHKEGIKKQYLLALKLLKEDPISESDSLYSAYMKVLDFVGCLTDNAAARMAREVSGIGMIK